MALFGQRQTGTDEIDVMLGRFRPTLRLLLKGVKDIDGGGKTHCVDRAERIAIMVLHNLQNASTAKAFQWLNAMSTTALLCV